MTTKIHLTGVRTYGYIGILPAESALGQWFEVDATLWVDFEAATNNDLIEDTYDYRKAINTIDTLIQTANFSTIERLAGAIADQIITDPKVEKVQLIVRKHPPIANFQGSVAVELERVK